MEAAVEEEKVFIGVPAVKEEEKISVAVPAVKEKEEKVFVAVPAEPRAGQSTLLWVLAHLYSSRATTIVVTHVHVPPQMIPISTCVPPPSALHTRVFRPLHSVLVNYSIYLINQMFNPLLQSQWG
jgi:hypothetical protein